MTNNAALLKRACMFLALYFSISFIMFAVFSSHTVVIQPKISNKEQLYRYPKQWFPKEQTLPQIQFETILDKGRVITSPVNKIKDAAREFFAPILDLLPTKPSPAALDFWSILAGNAVACLGLAYGITGLGIFAMLLFVFLADRRTLWNRKMSTAKKPGRVSFAPQSPEGYEMAVIVPSTVIAGLPFLAIIVLGAVAGMVTGILRPHVSITRSAIHNLMLFVPHGVFEVTSQILCAALPLTLFYRMKEAGFPMFSKRSGAAFMYSFLKSRFAVKLIFSAMIFLVWAAAIETFYTCHIAFYVDSLLSDAPINIQHLEMNDIKIQ